MINPIFDNVFRVHFPASYDHYFDPPEPPADEQIDALLGELAEQEDIIAAAQAEIDRIKGELRDLRMCP